MSKETTPLVVVDVTPETPETTTEAVVVESTIDTSTAEQTAEQKALADAVAQLDMDKLTLHHNQIRVLPEDKQFVFTPVQMHSTFFLAMTELLNFFLSIPDYIDSELADADKIERMKTIFQFFNQNKTFDIFSTFINLNLNNLANEGHITPLPLKDIIKLNEELAQSIQPNA